MPAFIYVTNRVTNLISRSQDIDLNKSSLDLKRNEKNRNFFIGRFKILQNVTKYQNITNIFFHW